MKNMLEELKKLDIEENIEVPSNFKSSVINAINTTKKSTFMKYIIPAASFAAVVMVGTLVIRQNRDFIRSKYIIGSGEENALVANLNKEELNDLQTGYSMNDMEDNAVLENSTEANKMTVAPMVSDDEYYEEIVSILKVNDIEADYKDEKVIVNGNIEDIKLILASYGGLIDITQDGENINIKIK